YRETRGAALLPALDPGARTSERLIRCRGGVARQDALREQGQVWDVSRPAALYGAGLANVHSGGNRHRRLPGEPFARQEVLPDDAPQGSFRPREGGLLP